MPRRKKKIIQPETKQTQPTEVTPGVVPDAPSVVEGEVVKATEQIGISPKAKAKESLTQWAQSLIKPLLIIFSFFGVIFGVALAYMGYETRQYFLVYLGMPLLSAGTLGLIFTLQKVFIRKEKTADGKKPLHPANSINVYLDKILFEFEENPQGVKHQLLNDNKWYYIHEVRIGGKGGPAVRTIVPLTLPDNTVYFDPREYGNVLRMSANRKLFEPIPSMFQAVAIGLLVLAVAIMGFVYIATTPAPKQSTQANPIERFYRYG